MCSSELRADRDEGGDAKPVLTQERRVEIEQLANRFGPPNCWTGTSGTLAAVIRELLNIID
jgi:hypothetical protein